MQFASAAVDLKNFLHFPLSQFNELKQSHEDTQKQSFSSLLKYGVDNVEIYHSKFANLYYGAWQDDPDKSKTAMKLICAGEEELVV